MDETVTKVYTADIRVLEEPVLYGRALELVPVYRREKTVRLRQEADRLRSLGAGLLLEYALMQAEQREFARSASDARVNFAGQLIDPVSGIAVGDHGKPHIPERPDFHYNLSHSGDMVMCIVSDRPVGCDIERYREKYMDIARRFFFEGEYDLIAGQPDEASRRAMFFRLWTLKESFMKVTGLGLSLPLDSFSIAIEDGTASVRQKIDDAKYAFFEYNQIEGYAAACAVRGYEGPAPQHFAVRLETVVEELACVRG